MAKVRPLQKNYLSLGKALHALAERYQLKQPLYPQGWDRSVTAKESSWLRLCAEQAIAKGLWQADPKILIEEPVCALVGPVDDRDMPLLCRPDVAGEGDDRHIKQPTVMHPEFSGLFCGLPLYCPGSDWTKVPYLVGFIDVYKPYLNPPEVHDHKSAKHRGYAKSPRSLVDDEQMLTYACITFARCHTVTEVVVQHNVFLKEYGKDDEFVYPVRATITLAEAQAFWKQFVADVEDTQRLRTLITSPGKGVERADRFGEVPGLIPVQQGRFSEPCAEDQAKANAKDGCGAYGGCPFRAACQGKATIRDVVAEIDKAKALGANAPQAPTGQAPRTDYTLKPRGTALGTRLFFPKT